MVTEKWGNELLCVAAARGCLPLIQRLMNKALRDTKRRTELLHGPRQKQFHVLFGKPLHQSIGEAVMGNHVDVVEYLLKQNGIEAYLGHQNSNGLHLASKTCNPEIFRILVPCFKGGEHQTEAQRNTPLSRVILSCAASQNRSESAKILLLEEGSPSPNQSGYAGEYEHPLRIAVRLGDLEMCRLLITIGKLDPVAALMHDKDGNVVLRDRSSGDEQTVLRVSEVLRGYANFGSMPAQ